MSGENINMLLWVTSKCNLKCRFCVVKYIQKLLPDYEMGMDEVRNFIQSSLNRNIHYLCITFAGGEPAMWPYLKNATMLILQSGITDRIELVSNGTIPERILAIKSVLSAYAISTTQCPPENIDKFVGTKVVLNSMPHKPLPLSPVEDTLPADCCSKVDLLGTESNQLNYINGKVYYCCNALLQSERVGLTEDLVCDFNDDFITKFADKAYDKTICKYCLCNSKVWEKLT